MLFRALLLCFTHQLAIGGGAYDVADASFDFSMIGDAASDSLQFKMHLFAPDAEGSFPVVFFAGGFAADAPVSAYSDLIKRIAADGYVFVGVDRLGLPHYPVEGTAFVALMEWAKNGNLTAALRAAQLKATPDVEGRSAVMGQSEGCHIVGQAMQETCSVAKAMVLVDPVDGYDPYRFVKFQDLITPGQKLKFAMPTLILDNGLDTKAVTPLFPPCMPEKMGTDRWWPALNGPLWNINATDYGHVDCLNKAMIPIAKAICKSNSSTDKLAYHAALAGATSTFLGALFNKRPQDLALLQDNTHWGVRATTKWDLKGLSPQQIEAGCSRAGQAREVPARPELMV